MDNQHSSEEASVPRETSTRSSTPNTAPDNPVDRYLLPTSFLPTLIEHRVPYSSRELGIRRGVRIEQWVIERKIGRGGFGTVHLQREKETNRVRAVKEIPHTTNATIDPLRELTAMAVLSKVSHLHATP